MNNEPNKPIEAEEQTEKELEGVVGGAKVFSVQKDPSCQVYGWFWGALACADSSSSKIQP